MNAIKDQLVQGPHKKPLLTDYFFEENGIKKPIIIFSHGFKGFKDWGHFELIAEAFAKAGFFFVKFNFAYNGTTPEAPTDFADLEAFSDNDLLKELDDLKVMIDHVVTDSAYAEEKDVNKIYLLGHSRGGGISILTAAQDERVSKLVTLGSVADFGSFFALEILKEWKEKGVIYIPNSRTNQQMPMKYSYVEALENGKTRLDVKAAVKSLNIPSLFIHGKADKTITFDKAETLKGLSSQNTFLAIPDGDHTFGGRHPWSSDELPEDSAKAVKATIDFLL